MPLWVFAHTPGAFSPEEKKDLAQAITRIYTRLNLPAFYVNVQFFEMAPSDIYVGGESLSNFTTISIHHVARAFDSESSKQKFLGEVDSVLNPRLQPKGINWEYFVQEAPRELWKINGLVPPPTGSELEKKWFRLNRPVVEEDGTVRGSL
ncbi:putative oxalocrotonate tautomerase [Thermoascus aurantiacus ATCC 26904]